MELFEALADGRDQEESGATGGEAAFVAAPKENRGEMMGSSAETGSHKAQDPQGSGSRSAPNSQPEESPRNRASF